MRAAILRKTGLVSGGVSFLVLAAAASATPQDDADALFAAESWAEAQSAYEALLETDPANAANWFSLARARHSADDHAGAVTAYRQAIEAGFGAIPRARYHLARALMALDRRAEALAELETLAESNGPPGSLIQGTAEFEPLAADPRFAAVVEALTPCAGPEFRAFDFWLGEWDVTAAGANQASATSRISSRHGGCVVLEEYDTGAYTGMSINFLDTTTGRWHQTWMANNGVPVYLEGNLDEAGAMVLTDADLPISAATGTINRVTWSTGADGSVRQFWETSQDGGANWSVAFDGLYTRREAGEE
ncbi:MAG: hypothetical protein AAGE05_08790 [Pseudomonadota bacterium]